MDNLPRLSGWEALYPPVPLFLLLLKRVQLEASLPLALQEESETWVPLLRESEKSLVPPASLQLVESERLVDLLLVLQAHRPVGRYLVFDHLVANLITSFLNTFLN